MLRVLCKSKIHGATVTEANLRYTGSVTIDADLMRAADLLHLVVLVVVGDDDGLAQPLQFRQPAVQARPPVIEEQRLAGDQRRLEEGVSGQRRCGHRS